MAAPTLERTTAGARTEKLTIAKALNRGMRAALERMKTGETPADADSN